ncbi:unnamed protein product [Protopolystoma xenopodis]|uniref:Uncharacterized protein n=1 Tax=Protopolystoma xenopodis TaxID=117903 RepID=A0A3S5A7H9_9PLAT|nr:unnamed protein product [Protopolystoma xenopodis]
MQSASVPTSSASDQSTVLSERKIAVPQFSISVGDNFVEEMSNKKPRQQPQQKSIRKHPHRFWIRRFEYGVCRRLESRRMRQWEVERTKNKKVCIQDEDEESTKVLTPKEQVDAASKIEPLRSEVPAEKKEFGKEEEQREEAICRQMEAPNEVEGHEDKLEKGDKEASENKEVVYEGKMRTADGSTGRRFDVRCNEKTGLQDGAEKTRISGPPPSTLSLWQRSAGSMNELPSLAFIDVGVARRLKNIK